MLPLVNLLKIYELASVKDNFNRARYLEEWLEDGGVMIIGYEMFRNLSQLKRIKNKKLKAAFTKTLLDPGNFLILQIFNEIHVWHNIQKWFSYNRVWYLEVIFLSYIIMKTAISNE